MKKNHDLTHQTPNNVWCVKSWFFWKGSGSAEKRCKLTFRYMNFGITGCNFTQCETYQY